MLGRGLESLIPKKQNIQSPQESQQTDSTEKPTALFEKNQSTQEGADAFRTPTTIKRPTASLKKNVSEAEAGMVSDRGRTSETDLPAEASAQAGSQAASERLGERDRGFSQVKPLVKEAIFHIEIEKIKPNPHQPRRDFNEESLKELAGSIREFGILQPLVVSKIEKETEFGADVEYQLIAGERRLMAAKMLGWERVPAIVKNIFQKSEQLAMAIIENLQRADLNPIETARAYAKLQDEFGLTQREIAVKIGKSRETIANSLRLLNLAGEIQEALAKNQINESQARLLLIIEDLTRQQNLFKELLTNNLSVRELRSRIRKTQFGEVRPPEIDDNLRRSNLQNIDPEIVALQEKLAELLGAQVKINPPASGEKGGKIVITFYSPEEIQGIIKKLSPNDKITDN